MSIFEPTESLGTMPVQQDEFQWSDDVELGTDTQSAPRHTIRWLYVIIAVVLVLLCGRLGVLQITEGQSHQLLAQGNRVRSREVLPSRGLITDRFGVELATNVASFQVVIVPADLPATKSERVPIYTLVAELLNESEESIRTRVEADGLRSIHPVVLLEHLDQETALRYLLRIGNAPGVSVAEQVRRNYVHAPGLAHVLGYNGKVSQSELESSDEYSHRSIVGKAGVERAYEARLYGSSCVERLEVNSRGYFQRVIGNQPAQSGQTVALSLDLGLQQRMGELLAAKMTETESVAGVGVAMDPRDGSILAMVSLPDYDNNLFAAGISADELAKLSNDQNAPLTNRAIA
ncbi:MAG: hypothetical protein AAB701_00675, partial [Patescibacteria group bacterium]